MFETACPMGAETATNPTDNSSTTTEESRGTSTESRDTESTGIPAGLSTETTLDVSTGVLGSCGDGVKDEGEECDDGNLDNTDRCLNNCKDPSCGDGYLWKDSNEECDDGNDHNDDGCLDTCKIAKCGDGFIQAGVEVCDDGVDNGQYNHCKVDCSGKGDFCGDGEKNGPEQCDPGMDQMEKVPDGCLPSCAWAKHCQDIFDEEIYDSNVYEVNPNEKLGSAVEVWCEMVEAEKKGYTFMKLDFGFQNFKNAQEANTACSAFGYQLFVPRNPFHLETAYKVATEVLLKPANDENLGKAADEEFGKIFGIFPNLPLADNLNCTDLPFNSQDCPQWHAIDQGEFFISGDGAEIIGQPSDAKWCESCSMFYAWDEWPTKVKYQTAFDVSSSRVMCNFPSQP